MRITDAILGELQKADAQMRIPARARGAQIRALVVDALVHFEAAYQERLTARAESFTAAELHDKGDDKKANIMGLRASASARNANGHLMEAMVLIAGVARLTIGSDTLGDNHAEGMTAKEFIWLEMIVRGGQ